MSWWHSVWSASYRYTKEVGLVHDVQHHFPHFSVIHSEVMVGVLLLFHAQQFHHSGQGLSNDPDPIVGEAMKLAGLHTFLLELPAVLPLVLLGGLTEKLKIVKDKVASFQIQMFFST